MTDDELKAIKARAEIERLRHDIVAYQGALGNPIPGSHNGRLSDGTTPENVLSRAVVELRAEPAERGKNQAYAERNQLVAAISKLLPSHLARHPEDDLTWEDDWRWIVVVNGPAGQMTWHIHDSEREQFNHLSVADYVWDGHSTDEKYRRLAIMRRPVDPVWGVAWLGSKADE